MEHSNMNHKITQHKEVTTSLRPREKKAKLIMHIKNIIEKKPIRTQQVLREELLALGYNLNQSTVWRLLQQVGAIKVMSEDGDTMYQMPVRHVAPNPGNTLQSCLISIEHNEATIVISTIPGAASLVARVLDYEKEKLQILGTIAGDDVIFIAPVSTANIITIFQNIKARLFYGSEKLSI